MDLFGAARFPSCWESVICPVAPFPCLVVPHELVPLPWRWSRGSLLVLRGLALRIPYLSPDLAAGTAPIVTELGPGSC